MRVTRLFTGADGESHFEDVEIALADSGPIGALSEKLPATGLIFRYNDEEYDYDWHNAPCRQYIVMLEGAVEIEVGDGTRRIFRDGDVLLAEDVDGRGHISRAVDGQPRRSLFITLE
ncbi:MAG: hypothetical protein RQ754_14260 [Desulfuromonadales bacterium]|nr:hypothetical protein [Desulfuromonadales bacterium]